MKRTLTLFCLGLALTFALAGCTRDKMPNVTPTPAGGSPVSTVRIRVTMLFTVKSFSIRLIKGFI